MRGSVGWASVAFFASCCLWSIPARVAAVPEGTVGTELDHYLKTAVGMWLSPLGLQKQELSLCTDFEVAAGLSAVSIEVLSDEGACDPSKPRWVLKTHLMLYNGVRARSFDYHEPGSAAVSRDTVEKRIAAALGWVVKSYGVEVQSTENVKAERLVKLVGAKLSGEAWFDEASGVLNSLDLSLGSGQVTGTGK